MAKLSSPAGLTMDDRGAYGSFFLPVYVTSLPGGLLSNDLREDRKRVVKILLLQ